MRIKPRNRKERLNLILYCAVTVSFIVPIIFLVLRMVYGRVPENAAGYHSDADYALMLTQCVLGLLVINIPLLLAKQFRFKLPVFLYTMYIIFLYCAIFLGEVRSFFYIIPGWDNILHGFSSLMLGFFGFMVITILNRDEHVMLHLSPMFSCVFAFCFALTIGCIWEIYEYTFDGILGLNMQKFMLANGTLLVGHSALTDTMKDIIIDALGALTASVFGYISIKKDKKWFHPELTDDKEKPSKE